MAMPNTMAAIAMLHLLPFDRPFFWKGSFNFIIGYCACSVRVLPNNTFTIASALIAQPLALSNGAKLRLRNFIHANIIDGPEIASRIQIMSVGIAHQPFSAIFTT